MPPLDLLAALILLTAAAVAAEGRARRRAGVVYRRLGRAHDMHYSRGDPLRLTPRVAAAMPVPGAAAVRVIDLLYRTDAAGHHYVFTAEYTVGVVAPHRRLRRAAAFAEPRGATGPAAGVRLGPEALPLVGQYESLLAGGGGPDPSRPPAAGPDGGATP